MDGINSAAEEYSAAPLQQEVMELPESTIKALEPLLARETARLRASIPRHPGTQHSPNKAVLVNWLAALPETHPVRVEHRKRVWQGTAAWTYAHAAYCRTFKLGAEHLAARSGVLAGPGRPRGIPQPARLRRLALGRIVARLLTNCPPELLTTWMQEPLPDPTTVLTRPPW